MAVYDVTAYGAVGDGVTDDRASIQNAINACSAAGGGDVYCPKGTYFWADGGGSLFLTVPANIRLRGEGYASALKPVNTSGNTVLITGSNVTIRDLRVEGSTPGVFCFSDGVNDGVVQSVYFRGSAGSLGQCIWIWECRRIDVRNCTFNECGYCVMQQNDKTALHIRITDCLCADAYGDLVNMNSGGSAVCADWIIANNQFTNAVADGVEVRFVGITKCDGVIIANNYIFGAGGDSAVHLEGPGGHVEIVANFFKNCRTSGGNLGYIYVLHSEKTVLINGNTFVTENTSAPLRFAVDTSNSSIAPRIMFTNNRVVAMPGSQFGGVAIDFNQGQTDISQNEFRNVSPAIRAHSTLNVKVENNDFIECGRGIYTAPGSSTGGGGSRWKVTGNRFVSSSQPCLEARRNTSGTGAPTEWVISDNHFDNTVRVFDGVDIYAHGNTTAAGVAFDIAASEYGGGARQIEKGRFVVGSGLAVPW